MLKTVDRRLHAYIRFQNPWLEPRRRTLTQSYLRGLAWGVLAGIGLIGVVWFVAFGVVTK